MKTKICSRCKIEKPHSDYFKNSAKKNGIRCRCKECDRIYVYSWRERNKSEYNNYAAAWRAKNPDKQHAIDIKRHYGLTGERYKKMLLEQQEKCKICGQQHYPALKRGRLYVDHDHETGKVRALLCGACNSGIGYFNHRQDLLIKAAEYLKLSS